MSKIKSYYFDGLELEATLRYSRHSIEQPKSAQATSEQHQQYLGSHLSKKQLKTSHNKPEFNFDI